MNGSLALDQAPPFSVPLRFFLTAPLFGAVAGLVLAHHGAEVLASRWSMPALMAVHLITLGFMLQVMTGALLQFMPVAAGANVWRPMWVAGAVHPGLALGAGLLVAGFGGLGQSAWLGAAALLLFSLALLVGVTAAGLIRSKAIGPTLPALRYAVGGLLVTAGLGVTLLGGLGFGWRVPLDVLTQVHAGWGLLGWALMLVLGVAYLVVPMFQLTPGYPTGLAFGLPRALLVGLALGTAGALLDPSLAFLGLLAALGAVALFAGLTLWLQSQRRRAVVDTTFRYWRLGVGCLLASVVTALAVQAVPPGELRARLEYLLGVLAIAGAFPALISGMLYKIVGFLAWLHLQRRVQAAPHMHKVMPEPRARAQLLLFTLALVLLALGAAWPPLVSAGGVAYALACLALEFNLLAAARLYRRVLREATIPPAGPPKPTARKLARRAEP